MTFGHGNSTKNLDDGDGHPLCAPSGVVTLLLARPYRPLPPWQAIGARPSLRVLCERRGRTSPTCADLSARVVLTSRFRLQLKCLLAHLRGSSAGGSLNFRASARVESKGLHTRHGPLPQRRLQRQPRRQSGHHLRLPRQRERHRQRPGGPLSAPQADPTASTGCGTRPVRQIQRPPSHIRDCHDSYGMSCPVKIG